MQTAPTQPSSTQGEPIKSFYWRHRHCRPWTIIINTRHVKLSPPQLSKVVFYWVWLPTLRKTYQRCSVFIVSFTACEQNYTGQSDLDARHYISRRAGNVLHPVVLSGPSDWPRYGMQGVNTAAAPIPAWKRSSSGVGGKGSTFWQAGQAIQPSATFDFNGIPHFCQ